MKIVRTLLICLMSSGIYSGLNAQCNTTPISGDLVISSDMFLSGTYNISGNFIIQSGVTVYVEPYSMSSCGKLEINAAKIIIYGNINGDYAGYPGGNGGNGGSVVSSLTGDLTSLDDCSNEDNSGQVTVEGGKAGFNGNGPGNGFAGSNASSGSGPKQTCQTWDDEAGLIAGGGGAGGGGGASYGGSGSVAATGGDGSDYYLTSGINISTAYVVVKGNGGNGGNAGATYGTNNGLDIDAGSGGAGGGGGGRSYYTGLPGGRGGNGGAMIKLTATDTVRITGTVSANGENGLSGGIGGDGGVSAKCCSDGCDDAGETTVSSGSGGGAGGGGGSGGGIYVESQTGVVVSGILNANGGNGGASGTKGYGATSNYGGGGLCSGNSVQSGDGENGGTGGAGSGGRIKISVTECVNANISGTINTTGGNGNGTGGNGTYALICSALSIEEFNAQLRVYPNPVDDELNISLNSPDADNSITITDVSGKMLLQQKLNSGDSVINLSAFPSGMYFFIFSNNKYSVTKKIIKL